MRMENWRKTSSLKLFLKGSGLKGLSKVQQTVCITSTHDNIMWQVFIIILYQMPLCNKKTYPKSVDIKYMRKSKAILLY